jgi:para-aminobenzoate synthetase component 1
MAGIKQKMLSWSRQFNIFCLLDNQHYEQAPHRWECLLAAQPIASIETADLSDLDRFFSEHPGWKFGHLAYDLRTPLYPDTPQKTNRVGFAPSYFFVPAFLLVLQPQELRITAPDPNLVWKQLQEAAPITGTSVPVPMQPLLDRAGYLQTIEQLRAHIRRGDCYEINFCQEFFAEHAVIDPFLVYANLCTVSPNPFMSFYRLEDKYLLCASPERFLARQGNRLISQPIKGTIRRGANEAEDEALRRQLQESAKDQSENVMVVDLVRNDLSRICKDDSVRVEELFGIYAYPQVFQMISTISGEIPDTLSFSQIMEAMFPMGSMTGAPKYKVLELIARYERQSRGLFSGSVGYIDPAGNFDFNVVIRSLLYNQSERYLSYQVGSGITWYSEPMLEWEECLLKAAAIKKVLAF